MSIDTMDYKKQHHMEILWKKSGEEATIYRIYGQDLQVNVPAIIEGYPVTTIGAYCFSASERCPKEGCMLTAVDVSGEYQKRIETPSMPEIAGKYLEEVTLPQSIKTLENAGFYNCRNLKLLFLGDQIRSIGSEEFMNCVHLKKIVLRGKIEGRNGLDKILERISLDLQVLICPDGEHVECDLFYPEYYEWLNEVTPAHVFDRSIHGEGFRMRQAFQDHALHLGKYDQCFPKVLVVEPDSVICQIAFGRLRYPKGLSTEAEQLYKNAIRERFDSMIKMIRKERSMEALHFLCDYFQPSSAVISAWMEECIEDDWSEAGVYLMEKKQSAGSFAEKEFSFDDLDW